ncbi:MAG: VTT domain-containing protein [Candidatus Korarchaeota archaeon]|nr:VTT domain-containing protein [Candidatus Korarchaeota archaeon]
MSLTQLLIEIVSAWIRDLGWIGVFGGVMLETAITIIPSPLVPMAAGFSLIPTDADFMKVLATSIVLIGLTGSIAATLGSLAHYAIGYYGGRPLIERYGKWLGISWNEVESFTDKLSNGKESLTIFASRALPIVPLSIISIGAGLLKIKANRFTLFTFLGCLPRYTVLGIAGYLVGIAYEEMVNILDTAETAVAILIIVGIALYILVRRLRG